MLHYVCLFLGEMNEETEERVKQSLRVVFEAFDVDTKFESLLVKGGWYLTGNDNDVNFLEIVRILDATFATVLGHDRGMKTRQTTALFLLALFKVPHIKAMLSFELVAKLTALKEVDPSSCVTEVCEILMLPTKGQFPPFHPVANISEMKLRTLPITLKFDGQKVEAVSFGTPPDLYSAVKALLPYDVQPNEGAHVHISLVSSARVQTLDRSKLTTFMEDWEGIITHVEHYTELMSTESLSYSRFKTCFMLRFACPPVIIRFILAFNEEFSQNVDHGQFHITVAVRPRSLL